MIMQDFFVGKDPKKKEEKKKAVALLYEPG